ncbi:MAG: DUF2520 domain-containing protein [bacterium]
MSVAGPRLAVGVLGAGRVGSVLGAALQSAGHSVVAASGVSLASRRRAERLLPGVPLRPADEVAAMADLVLVAVPDDDLVGLVSGLAATGTWRAGQIIVHTSGAHGLAALAPAAAVGVLPLALHPVMTFTGRPEDLDRLRGAVFGVTALPDYRAVAETLVLEMGGDPVWVPDAARPLYHAALSHAANHLVTLICDAVDLLGAAGVDAPARALSPLVSAALDNALRLSDGALTGPVARGDVDTVRVHRTTLELRGLQVVESYLAMARRTAVRAEAAGQISAAQRAELAEILAPAGEEPSGA